MKEFKGTPGPWVVNEIGLHWNNKELASFEITYGEDGECICDTVCQREDANLIAAAPELLEALQRITPMYEALLRDCGLEHKEMIATSHAAIKKALGETK